MATRRPLATDISQIEQVDPGVYRDTVGGGYYSGSWDSPVYRGDTYANGQFSDSAAPQPTPSSATPQSPAPGPAVPGPQIDKNPIFLPGGSPTVPPTATTQTAQQVSPNTFSQSAASTAPAPPQFLGASTSPNDIAAYFASRGATPYPTSVAYWVQQWPTLYQRGQQLGDPNYAFSRLAAADEFNAGGSSAPPTTTPHAPATPAAGGGGTMYGIHDTTGQSMGSISNNDVTPYDPGVYVDKTGKFYTTDGKGGAIFLGTDGQAAIKWVAQHGTASGVPGGGTNGTPGGPGGPGGTVIPPGSTTPNLPGGYGPLGGPLDPNLNQVGQDPLSQILNSALGGIMETGGTPYGQSVISGLNTIINGGGQLASTLPLRAAARDDEAAAMQGQLADARSALAARGTADEPGVAQGATVTAIDRITRGLAPAYASKIADIEQHALDTANTNVMQALTLATGMSENQAANVLQAASVGTTRQQALANIALASLDQNRQWQQFTAQYGLDREKLAYMVQQQNTAALTALLQQFLTSVNTSAGGFI